MLISHDAKQHGALLVCPGQAEDLGTEAVRLLAHPVGKLAGKL